MKKCLGLAAAAAWMLLGQGALAQTAAQSPAAAVSCANAATQARMSECAYEDFLAAGEGYSASYKALSQKTALQTISLNAEDALRENTSLFAHGVGLLLQHTGRIRMFGQDATLLFEAYVIALAERLQRDASPA